MTAGGMSMADLLREKITCSGRSVHAVAQEAGVKQPVLWRFLNHRQSLHLSSVEKLCDYFGLELRLKAEK